MSTARAAAGTAAALVAAPVAAAAAGLAAIVLVPLVAVPIRGLLAVADRIGDARFDRAHPDHPAAAWRASRQCRLELLDRIDAP